jgi:pimeloyl-ACP methyl ester carboxylesterase
LPHATTLVLLPGLDGTDVFFRPLLAALPQTVSPIVVSYPCAGANGYDDLLPRVREAVAGVPNFFVLGWSFSGPLALMLAAEKPQRTRGVILAASFVWSPRPRLSRLRFAAVGPVIWTIRTMRRLPIWLTLKPGDTFRRAKAETWGRVGAGVLAARVRAILGADARAELRRCRMPLRYIVSRSDSVVPRRNAEDIVRIQPAAKLATIDGPHLALYSNPQVAFGAILRFMAEAAQPLAEAAP